MRAILFTLILTVPQVVLCQNLDRGIALLEAKDFTKAEVFFQEAVKRDSKDHAAHFFLSRAYLGQKNIDPALDHIKKAVSLNGKHAEYQYWLGEVYKEALDKTGNVFKKRRYANGLREAFLEALSIDPKHLEARISLVFFYKNAPSIVGGGDHKAIKQLETLKRLHPENKQSYTILAQLYLEDDEPELALNEYEQAFKKNILNESHYSYLMGSLWKGEKNYENAHRYFNRALALGSEGDQNYYWNAAYEGGKTALISKKYLQESIIHLEGYHIANPDASSRSRGLVYLVLGRLYEATGQVTKAKQNYQLGVQADAKNKEIREALSALQ